MRKPLKKDFIMSPALSSIIIFLTVCVYAVTSTDLVLKEGDYYNFTCTSDADRWYVTSNNVSTLVARCDWYGDCFFLDDIAGVRVGSLFNGGTFFYFAVFGNMTKVSCSNQYWNLIITDRMHINVLAITLRGNSDPFNSVVIVDAGKNLDFQCTGHGPPGTTFTIKTNYSMVSVLTCGQDDSPSWTTVWCWMTVDQCGVLFDVYCQVIDDVTINKTIRVSSSKCPSLNQDRINIRVDAFTLLNESFPLPSIVAVDVGRTLEFRCTGRGPQCTTFTIRTNKSMAYVTPSDYVKESETTVNVSYVTSIEQCGDFFEVSCQALYYVTTKKIIIVSSSECPNSTQGSQSPEDESSSSKLTGPLTASGVILAISATCVCLVYRIQLGKRRSARNEVRLLAYTRNTSMTSIEPLSPYVNASYTDASLEPPHVAVVVLEHWPLPPSYSMVVRDPEKYKMTSAASFLDRPPLYESLINQQATQT